MTKHLLLTRPDSDRAVKQISAWADNVVHEATSKGNQVIDLIGVKAKRKEVEGRIKKIQPELIFFIGHGNKKEIAGQDNEILVRENENEAILNNSIVYALACSCGASLGSASVNAGAKAFIGYKDEYIFTSLEEHRTHPKEDRVLALFMNPSNQIAISLVKGHTVEESHLASKNAIARNINKLLNSEVPTEESSAIPWLYWNYQNQIFHGDGKATL